ncbi:DegV domain-containing protein SAV1425 [Acholeplasma oculi]|uniref:DAK1/DegV-like protein n=1 Tax=Acholeplasma oculi TaxID=35623 RepID=A0A061AH03_9MOLU|nr:DegV family protein [Acholeplasma oculi]CDR30881.1 DAK1/DegV-like protein [Acholeplasma oculi]SKC35397.1 EDD domain protein, DegV family [Acholeplasma oculi]SUT90023.1 DegV domain-containing protein SAV1425 [Acholeplasma oculi]
MIKLIIDSTCDLDSNLISKFKIDVVPLQVIVNGHSYKDKFEMSVETLYDHIRNSDDVKTSLPAYDDIAPIFEKYAKENQPFIFISFAKALSGTNNFANILVKELQEKYSTQMAVVDSKNGGLATAMMVEDILDFMQTHDNFDEIVNFSNELAAQMHHVIMLDDLTQLRKGGRISAIKSVISSVLSIKPVLKLDQGYIKHHKNGIGKKRALIELVNYVEANSKDKNTVIGVNYSANEELLNDVLNLLAQRGFNHIRKGRIASVMTAHIGLDAVSLCFLGK